MVDRRARTRLRRSMAAAGAVALAAGTLGGLAGSAQAEGTTVYVNPGGYDSPRCGAIVQQCLTIQAGIDHAEAGDTVAVAPGTYHEVIHLDRGIRVVGELGATIDGTGKMQPGSLVGVVHISGDATTSPNTNAVTGFTIRSAEAMPGNGVDGANGVPVLIALADGYAADAVTVADNTLIGSGTDTVAISGTDNVATTTITGNDVSASRQGVALRDNGPVRIDGNVFHDLTTSGEAGGQGVVLTAANGGARADQVVHGNTFRDYAGDGVVLAAGDDGTCAADPEAPCAGALSGEVTANTFDLRGTGAGLRTAAAIRFDATDGFALTAQSSGNVGVVGAPTRPVVETTARGGSLTVVSPGPTNTITPVPAPYVTIGAPRSVDVGGSDVALTTTTVVPTAAEPVEHARTDLSFSGEGLAASDLELEQKVGDTYQPVTLTDGGDGTVTGTLGDPAGVTLADAGVPVVTTLRLAAGDDAPLGRVTLRAALVEASTSAGHVVVNEQASDSTNFHVQKAATTLGTPTFAPAPTTGTVPMMTIPVVSDGEVDGGTVSVTFDGTTRTATVEDGVATVALKKFTAGPRTLVVSYGGTATTAALGPTDVVIEVAKVTPTITSVVVPTQLRTSTRDGRIVVTVAAPGTSPAGGVVRMVGGAGKTIATGTLNANGKAKLAVPRLSAATRTWTLRYQGNGSVLAGTGTVTFTVKK